MRQSSIDLVQSLDIKQPILDIGGAGFRGIWGFDTKILDLSGNVDYKMDATKMDIESESLQTVITTDTLEHVRYPQKMIDEIYRILIPGGMVICTTVLIWDFHEYPGDYWRFTLQGLELLFTRFRKIKSGWKAEDVPFGDKSMKLEHAGVYFVGKKHAI